MESKQKSFQIRAHTALVISLIFMASGLALQSYRAEILSRKIRAQEELETEIEVSKKKAMARIAKMAHDQEIYFMLTMERLDEVDLACGKK